MDKSEFISNKRTAFRKKYSGIVFNSNLNALLVLLTFSTSLLHSGAKIDWQFTAFLIIPLGFLYGEAVLYLTHRYQQHQKIRFGKLVFEMHAVWHHGMFSDKQMNVDSLKDMNMVMLPFFIYVFVLGMIYLPAGYLVQLFFDSDIAWLLMFSITLHLIWYEIVHTLSHVENPPFLKRLAQHHREHHNPKLMGKYNFGIATTVFDRVFGTRYSTDSTADTEDSSY